MNALLRRLANDTSGATAIEYALIGFLVCLAPAALFGSGGEALAGLMDHAAAKLISAGSSMLR